MSVPGYLPPVMKVCIQSYTLVNTPFLTQFHGIEDPMLEKADETKLFCILFYFTTDTLNLNVFRY